MRFGALLTTTAALIFGAPAGVRGQGVLIAPQAVVIDGTRRTSELTLVNDANTPAEVAISALYGYPVTDSAGVMTLRTFEVVDDTAPSVASWVQVFPSRLVLAPRSRRTIRILIAPPDSTPRTAAPRERWARLVVAVRGGRPVNVETSGTAEGISVGLTLEVRSVLGLFYRDGPMTTGVHMAAPRTHIERDTLVARVALTRTGNAAFVGSLIGTLRDQGGKIVGRTTLPLGVYYTLDPRLALPVAALPPGRYALTVEAVASRPDVPARALLRAAPAVQTTAVTVP